MDTTVSASSAQEEELAQKYLGLSAGKVLVKIAVPHPEGLRYYIALASDSGLLYAAGTCHAWLRCIRYS